MSAGKEPQQEQYSNVRIQASGDTEKRTLCRLSRTDTGNKTTQKRVKATILIPSKKKNGFVFYPINGLCLKQIKLFKIMDTRCRLVEHPVFSVWSNTLGSTSQHQRKIILIKQNDCHI